MNSNQEQFLNENLLRYSSVQTALGNFQNLLMGQLRGQVKSLGSWLEGAKEVRPYSTEKEIWCQYKDLKHKNVWLVALFVRFQAGYLQPGLYLEIHKIGEEPVSAAIEKHLKGKSLKCDPRGSSLFYITPENPEDIKDLSALQSSFRTLIKTANDILGETAGK